MLKIRPRYTGSWLDPDAQGKLSFDLANRLLDRCTDENGAVVKGVFITLTYRPGDYRNPFDLYKTHGERQDVPMFLRRLSKFLEQKLTGRWFCKQEFQKNGAVHWHIILLGVEFIAHADLARLWGHGFAYIQRLDKNRVRYACKYVAKGGGLPPFLLGEAPRSVKIIRVSPGFWKKAPTVTDHGEVSEPPPLPEGQAYIEDYGLTPQDVDGPLCMEDVPKNRFGHQTMEKRLAIAKRKAVAVDGTTGKFFQLEELDYNCLMVAAVQKGGELAGREKGWLTINNLDPKDIKSVCQLARILERDHRKELDAQYNQDWGLTPQENGRQQADDRNAPAGPLAGGPRASGGGEGGGCGAGLHLINTRNPDWRTQAESHIPLHLRRGYPKWAADHWLWDALNESVWRVSQILQDIPRPIEEEHWEMAA